MPTYEYACKSCEERLEVQQRFTDEPLTVCPACAGPLRKVFGSVGIAFKGSGFYKNDARGGTSTSSSSSSGAGTSTDAGSGSSSSSSDSGSASADTSSSTSTSSTAAATT